MTRFYNNQPHTSGILSVAQHLFRKLQLTLIILIVILAASCEKGILKIGSDILPDGDFVSINSIDTLSVFSYTMYDSIRTDNPTIAYLGEVYDPYFGTTTAEFVTQLRLGGELDTGTFVIDSVRLYLQLLTTKGGTGSVPHTLRISEISQQIYPDSAYYSRRPVSLTGYTITDIELPANLRNDTINEITLNLPVDFGNYLIRNPEMLFHSNSKPDFRSFFKGLYFQMDPGIDPLIVSLYLEQPGLTTSSHSSSSNIIVLYMHDEDDNASQYFFILDAKNKNAAFNRFSHNFSTAILGNKMAHINTTFQDTLSYLQALNGVYTKVVLPGLADIKNDPALDKIAINKARLIVPVYFDSISYGPYITPFVPTQLVLRYKTTDGTRYVVPDWNVDATYRTFFDGTLDSTAREYKFNIPSFVQAYLEDAEDQVKPELEIYQGLGTRNVILGANKSKTPVKFDFSYTKF